MDIQPLPDDSEWRETAACCAYATFFHTPEWFTAFQAGEPGWKKKVLKFSFPDGSMAIFPFLSCRTSWTRRLLLSGPAGVYGGWISKTPLLPDQQQQITDYLTSRYHAIIWRFNPFAGMQMDLPYPGLRPDHTIMLDLELGFETIFRSWSKGHHAAVNQARHHGVQVRRGSAITDWQDYFSCYQDSLRRWDRTVSSRYHWELFAALAQLPKPTVSLWLAMKESRLLAGAVCFSHARHTAYWHGAAYEDTFPDRPVHLLMYEIIRDSWTRGDKWFDFNPSGGHRGVEQFKKGFGGQPHRTPVLELRRTGLKDRLVSALRYRLGPADSRPSSVDPCGTARENRE